MQRNTITTLGELRTGDRFCFVMKDEVWQVTGFTRTQVTINKFTSHGTQIFKHDEMKLKKTAVRFLRHTMPLAGEDCFIEDLNVGDVFCFNESIVDEYQVVSIDKDNLLVSVMNTDRTKNRAINYQTRVVFVGNEKEVVK
jgi:hypothetical protein